jgi:lipopolysaccharide biosynthesis glycosyltransferase
MTVAADWPSAPPLRPIHIALTFDDGFWAPAYATMRSVCLHTHRRADLVFHLAHLGLAPPHKTALEAIAAEFGARLEFHDISASEILGARIARFPRVVNRGLHPIVYARLFLPDITGSAVTRLTFLDCDLFIRAPIERLHEIDLGDKVLAAASDPYRLASQTRREHQPRRIFDPADPYFNAGVMVIDAARWSAADITGTLLRELSEAELAELFYDQDILNYVMKNRWLILDSRWNFIEPRKLHEPLDPFIAHYTGPEKPWNLGGKAAYRRHYRHTMTNAVFYAFLRERVKRRLRLAR